MRRRFDSLTATPARFIRNPNPLDDQLGCSVTMALLVLTALVILGGLYAAGVINFDFTLAPSE